MSKFCSQFLIKNSYVKISSIYVKKNSYVKIMSRLCQVKFVYPVVVPRLKTSIFGLSSIMCLLKLGF